MFLQARGEGLHAFVGLDLVEDHAEDFRVFRAAEQLRLQFDAAGQFGQHFVFRCRDQDHVGVEAFGQVQIDPRGVTGATGRDHAFDDQHVLADGRLLIQGDDFFEQLVELAVAEHALDMGQAQGLRRFQAVGTGHQFGGALRPGITRMGLGDRFEKADLEAGPLEGTHQPEADGGQTHTKIGGCDKKSLHADSLGVHGNGDHLYLTIYRISVAKVIANRALCTPTASKGLAYFFIAQQRVQYPGPGLPRWLMAQVLSVAAGKLGHPVAVFVLMKACHRRAFRRVPSVRVVFAFGRLLR